MSTKRIVLFFVFVWLISSAGISGPIQGNKRTPIKIMTSIFPLKEFSQAVAGEMGTVDLLLPPGAEIHTWQPKPSDLLKLASADVFVHVGSELEPWVDDILRSVKNPDLRVIEACKGISLLGDKMESDHNHGTFDPHIWLDFSHDEKICDAIAGVLSSIDPENLQIFRNHSESYKQKLRALDERYREILDRCDQRTIVLGGHAAFGYLARRYKLNQISLYGLSPDTRPTPRQLIEIINYVKENRIAAIFFEENISSELARVIAQETGAKILVLNPGASLPRNVKNSDVTFLRMMERNLENLKNGLNCQ